MYSSRNVKMDFYNKKILSWGNSKNDIDVYNIFITCIRKNRYDLLKILLMYFPDHRYSIFEYRISYKPRYVQSKYYETSIAYERNVLNIIIQEKDNLYNYLDLFIYHNTDINSTDMPGSVTPLNLACIKQEVDLVTYLIEKGARPTSYHLRWAFENNFLHLSELILNKANYLINSSELEHAIFIKNKDAVRLLLNKGADPLPTTVNKTPLDVALEVNDLEIIDILMEAIHSKKYKE
jgi:ankyrin repeat protein